VEYSGRTPLYFPFLARTNDQFVPFFIYQILTGEMIFIHPLELTKQFHHFAKFGSTCTAAYANQSSIECSNKQTNTI